MKKIAIVGTASSFTDAPYDDESWEIWGLSGLKTRVPKGTRVDRWFELHTFDYLKREQGAVEEYFGFLDSLGEKLTTFQPEKLAPKARVLKRQDLLNAFGEYFTSTIAWVLGEAILENPDKIGLWGVHCAGDAEYEDQRPCIEGYIRFIQGMQKEVYIHPKSALFKAPLYCTDEFIRIKRGLKFAKERSMRMFDQAQYWKGFEDALDQFKKGAGHCEDIKQGM